MVRLATDCWLLTPTALCHVGSVLEMQASKEVRYSQNKGTMENEVISDSDNLHKDHFFTQNDCHGSNIHAVSVWFCHFVLFFQRLLEASARLKRQLHTFTGD